MPIDTIRRLPQVATFLPLCLVVCCSTSRADLYRFRYQSEGLTESTLAIYPPDEFPGYAGSRLVFTIDVYAPGTPISLDLRGGPFLPTEHRITYLQSYQGGPAEEVEEVIFRRDFRITGAAGPAFLELDAKAPYNYRADLVIDRNGGGVFDRGVELHTGSGIATGDFVSQYLSTGVAGFTNRDGDDDVRHITSRRTLRLLYEPGSWTVGQIRPEVSVAGANGSASGQVIIGHDTTAVDLLAYCDNLRRTGEKVSLFGKLFTGAGIAIGAKNPSPLPDPRPTATAAVTTGAGGLMLGWEPLLNSYCDGFAPGRSMIGHADPEDTNAGKSAARSAAVVERRNFEATYGDDYRVIDDAFFAWESAQQAFALSASIASQLVAAVEVGDATLSDQLTNSYADSLADIDSFTREAYRHFEEAYPVLEAGVPNDFTHTFGGTTYGSFRDLFDAFTLELLSVETEQVLAGIETLPGDFNGDGRVDSADYTVWRDNVSGGFTAQHYDLWAANYGLIASPTVSLSVPEPSAVLLAGLALTCWYRPSNTSACCSSPS